MNNQQKLLILAAIAGVSAVGLLIILSRRQREGDFEDDDGVAAELRDIPDLTVAQTTASASETVLRLTVPQYCVGAIIGKGGESIRQLKKETGARLDFEKDNEKNEREEKKDRILEIRGERENVHNAELKIKQLIAEMPPIVNEEILVPQAACGRIIGRGGQTIRELCQISGAKIIIDRNEERSLQGMRRVQINGNAQQVEYAKGLIEEKVEMEKSQRNLITTGKRRSPSPSARPRYPTVTLPSTEGCFKLFVSAFDIPGHFYIQLVTKDSSKLDQLTKEMTNYFGDPLASQNEKPPYRVLMGDMFCAPFEFDDLWYRATVLEVDENEKMATLFYIDYGDTGKIPYEDLRRPKPEYLQLEAQAIECFLANVAPKDGKWSEEAVDRFEELSHCAKWSELMGHVVQFRDTETGKVPCLELIDTTQEQDVNIADQLIKDGFAVAQGPSEASKENQLKVINEEIVNNLSNNNKRDVTSSTVVSNSPEVRDIPEVSDIHIENIVFSECAQLPLDFGFEPINGANEASRLNRDSMASISSGSTEDTVIHVADKTGEEAAIGEESIIETEAVIDHEAAIGEEAVNEEGAANEEGAKARDAIGVSTEKTDYRSNSVVEIGVCADKVQESEGNVEMTGKPDDVLAGVEEIISKNDTVADKDAANLLFDEECVLERSKAKGEETAAVSDEQELDDEVQIDGGHESKDSGVDLDSAALDVNFKKSVSEEVTRWMERSFEGSVQLETISEDVTLSSEVIARAASTELEASVDSVKDQKRYGFQASMEMAKENPILLSDDEDSLSFFSARSEQTISSNANETDTDTMSFKSAPDTPTNITEFDFPSKGESMLDYDVITTPVGSDDESLLPDFQATPIAETSSPKIVSVAVNTPKYQIKVIDESKDQGRSPKVASASLENVTSADNGKLSSSPQRISQLSMSMPQFGGLKTSQSRFGGSDNFVGKETSI